MQTYVSLWSCLALTAAFIPAVSPGSGETGMFVLDRNSGPADDLDGTLEYDAAVADGNVPLANVDRDGAASGQGIAIIFSYPPLGAIDASLGASLWDSISITFNGDASALTADDFAISVTLDEPPGIVEVQHFGSSVTLVLDSTIPAGAWTIFTHIESDTFTALASLPGDVNGDCFSGSSDILTLLDLINGAIDPLPIWSTDMNGDGIINANDVLSLIDMFNGALAGGSWLGVELCPDGCPEFGCP